MFRSLLIAVAVVALGMAGAVSTVSAAGAKGGGSKMSAKVASVKVLGFRATRAGGCGEFMYWKGGKCMDARDKTPEK